MAKIAPYFRIQENDGDGNPLSGGKIYTYEAGTTTEKETYIDAEETASNTNPIVLDSNGSCDIWLGAGSYKFVVKDSDGNTIKTTDNISGDSSNSFNGAVITTAVNLNVTTTSQNNFIEGTATLNLNLLDAASAGDGFTFSTINTGSGTITVVPDGSETINGDSSLALSAGEWGILTSDGTNWKALVYSFSFDNAVQFSNAVLFSGKVRFADDGERTISGGAISITGANHTVDTEGDAASDDLDTINTGVGGLYLILRAAHADRTVVLKHGTGNILTHDGQDITLDETEKTVVLIYDSSLSKWIVLSNTSASYTRAEVDALIPSVDWVKSSALTLSAGDTTYVFAHGLGTEELEVDVYARNTTSGALVPVTSNNGDSGNATGTHSVYIDSTNITFSQNANLAITTTGGGFSVITGGGWEMRIYAKVREIA